MRRLIPPALCLTAALCAACGSDFAEPAPFTPVPLYVTGLEPTSGVPDDVITSTGSFGGVSYLGGGSLSIYLGGRWCTVLPGWSGTEAQFVIPELSAGTYQVEVEISFGALESMRRTTASETFTIPAPQGV